MSWFDAYRIKFYSVIDMEIHILRLFAPIYYLPAAGSDPFDYGKTGSGAEKLFCFALDETEALNFEPDKTKFPGSLIFSGDAAGEVETTLELPGGNYLFAQERKILNRDEIISMAVEIQLEGLWQRRVPGKTLYLRYLFEDGRFVTQLFRPFT